MTSRLSLIAAMAVVSAVSAQRPQPRIIDLGHPIQSSDPSWDPKPTYRRDTTAIMAKDGYASGRITIDEHFGTHVDAPSHFAPNGWTVDRIPVDRLHRPGVRLDISSKARANADYELLMSDIRAFESRSGRIPEGSIVLVATGWDRFWPDRGTYMNEKGGVKHFPGLTPEAARYLAVDRRVAAIGIDTPSIDHGPSKDFKAHHASMGLNVYHIENARGLTKLPPTGFDVIVAPTNIVGGSGGPARIFAILR